MVVHQTCLIFKLQIYYKKKLLNQLFMYSNNNTLRDIIIILFFQLYNIIFRKMNLIQDTFSTVLIFHAILLLR